MGLYVTHDCWNASCSTFMEWRGALAEAADVDQEMTYALMKPKLEHWSGNIFKGEWPNDVQVEDPLLYLLFHSDCDGSLGADKVGPLADRLNDLLPKITLGDNGMVWAQLTTQFITGLREAQTAGEGVEFEFM